MKTDITKERVFDHFANKATPLQQRQIEEWLQSRTNEELYYKWLEEWETNNPEYDPNSITLVEKYLNFIQTTPRQLTPESRAVPFKVSRKWRWPGAVAASVSVLLLGLWLSKEVIYYKSYTTGNGEIKTLFLSDGSQVMLNARSWLRVPRWDFNGSKREVLLNGEANFSVTHTDDNRKFVVKTEKGFEVIVLGTEFSVLSRERGGEVLLNKGRVRVNYQEGANTKHLVMEPGQLVSFNTKNQASLKQVSESRKLSFWHEKRFVFDEMTLEDVAQMLEDTYGLSVEITSSQLAQQKLMGSFRADNLDELLQTIADLLDINVVRQEDMIRLSEKKP